jgi:proline-specific peptidase
LSSKGKIPVTGGDIWYRIVGTGNAVPLLALHGGPGFPHNALGCVGRLGKERPVVFYDQLGCGKSDRPEDPSLWVMERFIEELEIVRESLGLEETILLGHSFGAALAVEYLLQKPDGVKKLVLMGPLISAKMWLEDTARLKSELPPDVLATIEKHERAGTTDSDDFREAALVYYDKHVCRVDPKPASYIESIEGFGRDVFNYMWGPNEFTCLGSLSQFERLERLHEIDVPTLFLCGRYDEATPESVELFHKRMPGSQMHVFEHASHNPQLEQPEEFLQVMREFLNGA